jgi:DNA polymerase delta subunit 2
MTITRNLSETKYENLSKEYYLKEKTFTCQYAPLYAERLKTMRDEVKKAALKKWASKYPIKNLVDMEANEKCIIIGTLYKEMKNKPNILKELAEDENNQIVMQPVLNREKYIDVDDELILEDELQRIVLIDSSNTQSSAAKNIVKEARLCTGLVIALLGFENENSKFEIEDYCFKETPMVNHVSLKNSSNLDDHKYIVFVSGIELGDPKTTENMYKFQLFIDFLRGDFNQIDTQLNEYESNLNRMLKNTIRLVIAGNSLSSSTQSKDMHNKAKYLTKNFVAGSVSAIKEMDKFVSQLIDKIEVDLMPGEYDPTNLMLPQQPLHNAIFTASKHNNSNTNTSNNFHTTTNPYRFSLNNINFLGTSG